MKTIGLIIILSTSIAVSAKDVFVDVHKGKNSNPGTLEKPFRTIQHAANEMVSGDICYIRKGVYRETLIPRQTSLHSRHMKMSMFSLPVWMLLRGGPIIRIISGKPASKDLFQWDPSKHPWFS